jgi:hypothetical protein
LILYWILTIYRHKLISIKKPSQWEGFKGRPEFVEHPPPYFSK